MDITEREENLEHLWYLLENGPKTVDDILSLRNKRIDETTLSRLSAEGWVDISEECKQINFTDKGHGYARRLVRAHRLAERLLYDVLGAKKEEMEAGSCEFEHIVASELVDSICILLGHPTECPHGLPIPPGECCKVSTTVIESSSRPLTELAVGETARISYIYCKSDEQLHRLDSLHICPGVEIKLHQNYPSYVIECKGAKIAFEERVAKNIKVWISRNPKLVLSQNENEFAPPQRNRPKERFGWKRFLPFIQKNKNH